MTTQFDLYGLGYFIGGCIVTFIISRIFWFLAKKEKKPVYTVQSSNLIRGFESKLSKLAITYGCKEINNLTVSKFAFWNEGNETINQKDIIPAEPLSINSINEVEILDKELLLVTEPANMFRILENGNSRMFQITFDYMAKNDAAIIQIFHTGKSSEDIFLAGKIKEVREIKRRKLKIAHRFKTFHIGNIEIPSERLGAYVLVTFFWAFFVVTLFIIISTPFNILNWLVIIPVLYMALFFSKFLIPPEIPEKVGAFVQIPW